MSRKVKLIAAVLAAAVVLIVTGAAAIPRLVRHPITVTAQFEDAVGLYVGNGVSVLGMTVGKVTSIVAKDNYVEVKLAIDDGIDVPANAQAVTVSNSILTDRVVELTPPYRGGAKLKNGDVLGLGRTRTPVEFDRTLAMMDKLGKALHGDANGQGPLGDLVNLSADITSAKGRDIKAALDKLSQALRVGADKGAGSNKNIQAIITSLAELTQAAADNDATIRQFGSNLRQLAAILADEDLGSGSTGAKANGILAEAARLLEGNRDSLKDTFANARAIATTLTDNRRELEEFLDVGPLMVDNIYDVIDPVAGSLRLHLLTDKVFLNSQFGKEICNLMGLKQLACATGTLQDYGPDFGLTKMLDLMGNGISGQP
ncbi:MCE family protein [Mycolicibacter sinensis]|uniref:Mammalian cell entry protein n=1 Tax=Mycolicibacter sinensis (strain JDM601) TaxID=875328 RepID=A0A1A3U876_MYCSD|nr:MCE family protein [Mycolicibacter sinensis]OBK91101.1 mammalian cell entry protein [Mycolicibacter sinensis]